MCTHSATNGYDPLPARVITLNEQAAGPTSDRTGGRGIADAPNSLKYPDLPKTLN